MSSPSPAVSKLLTTKLYLPPARQTLVDRPVLLDQLRDGLKGRLTLVSAPAGFGKTSLVAAWRKQCETPLAWVSLDDEDNEPARFLDYLIGDSDRVGSFSFRDGNRYRGQSGLCCL